MAKKKKKNKLKEKKKSPVIEVVASPSLEPHQLNRARSIAQRLQNTSTYSDVNQTFSLIKEFEQELAPHLDSGHGEMTKKYFTSMGVSDPWGYRPQGSGLAQVFPNPFQIFAFLAENHHYILDCRNVFWREILSDGYRLEGNQKNFDKVKEICRFLNMKRLRAQIADHLKVYGNCFVEPIKNGLKGIKNFKLLLPSFIRPIPTVDGQNIKYWQYQKGPVWVTYDKKSLLVAQFRPAMRQYDLSNPVLGSVLIDIEADMAASMYNNVVFQKGGLIGLAVILNSETNGRRPQNHTAYAEFLQAEMNSQNAGARAGFQTVVFENTKDVKPLNDLASLDGAFHKTSDKCGKQIAHVLGVPHEMIGIITNANQQYHPAALRDYAQDQFDKSMDELTDVVDTFINTKILPMFGVRDVIIKAMPRRNANTRIASQALADLASITDLISINEGRVNYLGLAPVANGDRALQKVTINPGVKGGPEGGGTPPSLFEPNPFDPLADEIEDESSQLA